VRVFLDRRGTTGSVSLSASSPTHQHAFNQTSPCCCSGIITCSTNGSCVAEMRELPYDGDMWLAVCLRSHRQQVMRCCVSAAVCVVSLTSSSFTATSGKQGEWLPWVQVAAAAKQRYPKLLLL